MEIKKYTEAEFTRQVIQFAQLCGFMVAHFRPARTAKGWRTPVSGDGAGFPDLIMAKVGRVIGAELKTDIGRVTPEQSRWLSVLNGQVETYVWRPSQWQEIETILRG